jgi:hypothetical protein
MERGAHGPALAYKFATALHVNAAITLQDAHGYASRTQALGLLNLALHLIKVMRRKIKVAGARPNQNMDRNRNCFDGGRDKFRLRSYASACKLGAKFNTVGATKLPCPRSLHAFGAQFKNKILHGVLGLEYVTGMIRLRKQRVSCAE